MLPYIVLYAIMGITQVYFAYVSNKGSSIKAKKTDNALFVFYSLLLIIFISTRLETVGTDTLVYSDYFEINKYYSDNGRRVDIMFELLSRILHLGGSSGGWFIFATGIIETFGIIFLVNAISIRKSTSMMLFSIMGTTFIYLHIYLSAIRQCCAITYVVVATCLLFKQNRNIKELLLSILLFIIAFLTHGSTLVVLPFILWAYFAPTTSKTIWCLLIVGLYVLSALNISYVNNFLEFVFNIIGDSKYETYANITFGERSSSNPWINMLLLPYSAIGVFLLLVNNKETIKQWWFQLFLMSIVATNFFSDNLLWGRLTMNLSIFAIVAIPNAIKDKKLFTRISFYFVLLLYFYYKSFSALLFDQIQTETMGITTIVPYESWFISSL